MRKVIVALAVAVLLAVLSTVPAFAGGPSTVVVDWSGSGQVSGEVNTGDSRTSFVVDAEASDGEFTATDANDNPYGYGVDSNSAYIVASFQGGYAQFRTDRLTSYVPMYGPAGQCVEAGVFSTGTGTIATGSSTNYAAMVNGTYGKPWLNGANFTATGDYSIYQIIGAPSGNFASVQVAGEGSASVNCMTTQAFATRADLGWGAGCYTNAKVNATGSGWYVVQAYGVNGLATPIAGADGSVVSGGISTSGASSLSILVNFASGLSVGNFSVATK